MSTDVIVTAALVWLELLFLAVLIGERCARVDRTPGAWAYALALSVYGTSRMLYSTVAQALRSGWWLPRTFLGTIVLLALPHRVRLR